MGVNKMDQEEKFYQDLSDRIRNKRLAAGCTLQEVANAAGVSVQFMNDIEKGRKRISAYRLSLLNKFLKVGI